MSVVDYMNTETNNKYWEELAEDWDTRMGDVRIRFGKMSRYRLLCE